MGDALNWEWIIHCAVACKDKSNVMVVSRDGDFGTEVERSRWMLNDWLKMEFKERVGARRDLRLTPRLSDALRVLNESVPTQDAKEEESVISKPVVDVGARYSDLDLAQINKSIAEALAVPNSKISFPADDILKRSFERLEFERILNGIEEAIKSGYIFSGRLGGVDVHRDDESGSEDE